MAQLDNSSFSGWLFENELMLESYVVYHGGNHDQGTKLVAVTETSQKYTEIGISEGEGEFRIILRPLGGEMVAGRGFGGSAKYLVCECSPPESQYERQLAEQIRQQFGQKTLRYTTGGALPDYMMNALKVATGSEEIPRGITVHSNNVLFIIYTDSIDWYIKTVVDFVVSQVEPLIKNGFIHYVHSSGMVKVDLMNDQFRQERDSYEKNYQQSIGYLKTVLKLYLGQRYPLAAQVAESAINWRWDRVPPSDIKVHLSNNPVIKSVVGEIEGMGRFIIQATLRADDANLAIYETILKSAQSAHLDPKIVTDYRFMFFVDPQEFESFTNNKFLGILSIPDWFFDDKFEKTLELAGLERRYDLVKREFEQEVVQGFEDGDISHLPMHTVLRHFEKLNLPDKVKQALRDHVQKQEKEKQEINERRLKERTKNSALIGPEGDHYKWIKVGETEWKDVKHRYLDYNVSHQGGYYEIQVGDLALGEELVDREGLFYDAIEKAEEDANSDVESRPSESYGNKPEQVDEDIEEHADDFLDDFWDGRDEDPSEPDPNDTDAWIELIKTKYRQEFMQWRIEQMQQEEEENSWKYEPDTESHDFQMKVHDYELELAEAAAWEEGLITLVRNQHGIIFTLDSRHWSAFQPFFRQTLEWNWKTLDQEFKEPYIRASNIVEVYMPDKGTYRKPLSSWLGNPSLE